MQRARALVAPGPLRLLIYHEPLRRRVPQLALPHHLALIRWHMTRWQPVALCLLTPYRIPVSEYYQCVACHFRKSTGKTVQLVDLWVQMVGTCI